MSPMYTPQQTVLVGPTVFLLSLLTHKYQKNDRRSAKVHLYKASDWFALFGMDVLQNSLKTGIAGIKV